MLIIITGTSEIWIKTEKNKEKNSKLDNEFDEITQNEVQRNKDKNRRRREVPGWLSQLSVCLQLRS